VLSIVAASKQFGATIALDDVTLHVQSGEVVGLIGPNGAGKSTLLDVVSGLVRADRGEVMLDGRRLDTQPPAALSRLGLTRTFQAEGIFGDLSVDDNLRVAARAGGSLEPAFKDRRDRLLALTTLGDHHATIAGSLSYGQQRLLELAMALICRPKVVMLDEPVAGVNPRLIERISEFVLVMNQEDGVSFLVVEHNIPFVAALASRLVVLAEGRVLAEGDLETIRQSDEVMEHYLRGT
jgi:branched-chain amino acid transport system ATP-binding protein